MNKDTKKWWSIFIFNLIIIATLVYFKMDRITVEKKVEVPKIEYKDKLVNNETLYVYNGDDIAYKIKGQSGTFKVSDSNLNILKTKVGMNEELFIEKIHGIPFYKSIKIRNILLVLDTRENTPAQIQKEKEIYLYFHKEDLITFEISGSTSTKTYVEIAPIIDKVIKQFGADLKIKITKINDKDVDLETTLDKFYIILTK